MPFLNLDRIIGDAVNDNTASRHRPGSSSNSTNSKGPAMTNSQPTLSGESLFVQEENPDPDRINEVKKSKRTQPLDSDKTMGDGNETGKHQKEQYRDDAHNEKDGDETGEGQNALQDQAHDEDEEVDEIMDYDEAVEQQEEDDQDEAHGEEEDDAENDDEDDDEDDDESEDESEDEGDIEAGPVPQNTRLSNVNRATTNQKKGSSATTQQKPNGGSQARSTRKRGRPAKLATPAVGPKRARGKQERGTMTRGLRRSTREATKLSTQQVTEKRASSLSIVQKASEELTRALQQRGRKPAASTSSAPGHMKKTTRVSGGEGKQAPAAKPATPKRARAKPEYEVQLILDSRGNEEAGTLEYLVKWKGYHVKQSTWEPAKYLSHCPQAIEEYCSE
ncbi:hypothetical protein F4861DRAFT_536373 [Xylaria intraflava]|nr:hypothetical protein F4861DRAFT_536373 [Xylaria intraflava]